MEYTCIYEALPTTLLTPPFVFIIIFEIIAIVYSAFVWKKSELSGKIGLIFVTSFFLFIIGCFIYSYSASQVVWNKYTKGECCIAKGIIEDYENGSEEMPSFPDYFTVNGKEFIISESPSTGWGYTKRQCDGGVLENGLSCKIYYVPYRFENVIMEIHIIQDTNFQTEEEEAE